METAAPCVAREKPDMLGPACLFVRARSEDGGTAALESRLTRLVRLKPQHHYCQCVAQALLPLSRFDVIAIAVGTAVVVP